MAPLIKVAADSSSVAFIGSKGDVTLTQHLAACYVKLFEGDWRWVRRSCVLQGCVIPLFMVSFCHLHYNPTCVRGNFGLKLQNSPRLPRIHGRLLCDANENIQPWNGLLCNITLKDNPGNPRRVGATASEFCPIFRSHFFKLLLKEQMNLDVYMEFHILQQKLQTNLTLKSNNKSMLVFLLHFFPPETDFWW